MPLTFKESLRIQPLPLDQHSAVALATHFREQVGALGSCAAVARGAADGIFARSAGTDAGELARLQRLYATAYTREELERLMLDNLAQLGLED